MSRLTPELIEKVLALPREDRAYLAQRLLDSLDDPNYRLSMEEAERRMNDILSGKTHTIPGEHVFAEIAARNMAISR